MGREVKGLVPPHNQSTIRDIFINLHCVGSFYFFLTCVLLPTALPPLFLHGEKGRALGFLYKLSCLTWRNLHRAFVLVTDYAK
jgi:hypothetical protein